MAEPVKLTPEENPNLYRLHTTLYTLIYPAFLGSAILLVVLSHGAKPPAGIHDGWAVFFLVAYFTSQHVQNAVEFAYYSWPMVVLDFLEAGLMVWIFYLMGAFERAPRFEVPIANGICFFSSLTVCLLAPVASRWVTNAVRNKNRKEGDPKQPLLFGPGRSCIMSILSIAAACIAVSGPWVAPASERRWWALLLLLVFYFLTCVFKTKCSLRFLKMIGEKDQDRLRLGDWTPD